MPKKKTNPKELVIYQLTSENLTGLGGPMGSERTWDNWSKPFGALNTAKAYAEKDYKKQAGKNAEKIKWTRGNGGVSTQDLSFVMYHIRRAAVK